MKKSELRTLIREQILNLLREYDEEDEDKDNFVAVDVNHWLPFNTKEKGTYKGQKLDYKEALHFIKTFDLAKDKWNETADKSKQFLPFKGSQLLYDIRELARAFAEKTGWISINVVYAMFNELTK